VYNKVRHSLRFRTVILNIHKAFLAPQGAILCQNRQREIVILHLNKYGGVQKESVRCWTEVVYF